MIELSLDLWEVPADARCITTNGTVRDDGSNVMGGGCAREAAERYPGLPLKYGTLIRERGHRLFCIDTTDVPIVMFPVKYDVRQPANPYLIADSARQLLELTNFEEWKRVALPRPGCGLGGLDWESDVRPVLANILDDRFLIIDFPHPRA